MWAMENMVGKGLVTESVSCQSKTAYSQGGADRARSALRNKRQRHRVKIYHCRFCNHYHLTSIGA